MRVVKGDNSIELADIFYTDAAMLSAFWIGVAIGSRLFKKNIDIKK